MRQQPNALLVRRLVAVLQALDGAGTGDRHRRRRQDHLIWLGAKSARGAAACKDDQQQAVGAGEGNRTLVISLEVPCSADGFKDQSDETVIHAASTGWLRGYS